MDLVRTATVAGVTTLTLDSPANRNALSTPLMRQLLDAARPPRSPTPPSGPWSSRTPARSSAPAPTSRRPPRPGETGQVPAEMLADVLAALWEFPKPVVARIGGPARAGGLGLIAAADIAVCTTEATFAFSEVRLGVIPAVISATVLPRLTPRAAAELYLTGAVFDGVRAAEIGLVTAAVPAGELDKAVAGYCDALVLGGPLALAGTKQLLRRTPRSRRSVPSWPSSPTLGARSAGYFRSGRGPLRAVRRRSARSGHADAWVPRLTASRPTVAVTGRRASFITLVA